MLLPIRTFDGQHYCIETNVPQNEKPSIWDNSGRHWTEDYRDEDNGKYQHRCRVCHAPFLGHKRRLPLCRICATTPPPMPTNPNEAINRHCLFIGGSKDGQYLNIPQSQQFVCFQEKVDGETVAYNYEGQLLIGGEQELRVFLHTKLTPDQGMRMLVENYRPPVKVMIVVKPNEAHKK